MLGERRTASRKQQGWKSDSEVTVLIVHVPQGRCFQVSALRNPREDLDTGMPSRGT